MDELNIEIKSLQELKIELEVKVCEFTNYGRSPSQGDYYEMIRLLNDWKKANELIRCLTELRDTIINNEKQYPKTHPAT